MEKLLLRKLRHNDVPSGNLAFSSLFKKQNDEKHLSFFPVAGGLYFFSEKFLVQNETIKVLCVKFAGKCLLSNIL